MKFVGDPLAALQPTLAKYLRERKEGQRSVGIDGEIRSDIGWRPHLIVHDSRQAWHIHISMPETDSWFKRIARARAVDPTLRIGVAAQAGVFSEEEFILLCDALEAEIILVPDVEEIETDQLKSFASTADFIMETRTQLSLGVMRELLNQLLTRALTHENSYRRGVLFEVLVGLLLSQVRGFEVHDIDISNRSQQMDVLVQNRNAGGVLSGSPIVLAEAKNWKDPVTPTEYAEFVRKLQSRHGRAKLGFLITTGRFTEGVELERRRESKEDYLVVLINGTSLVDIWRSESTITDKIESLVISATVGS